LSQSFGIKIFKFICRINSLSQKAVFYTPIPPPPPPSPLLLYLYCVSETLAERTTIMQTIFMATNFSNFSSVDRINFFQMIIYISLFCCIVGQAA